jgi:integrase/recombinase XerD
MIGSERRCRPHLPGIDAWPQGLRAAWLTAVEPSADLFGKSGGANKWRFSTRLVVEKAFGTLLSTPGLDPIRDSDGVAEVVTRRNLKQLVRHMMEAGLKHNTQGSYISRVALGADAMAPDLDWSWVHRAGRTIRDRARQVGPASIPVSTSNLLMTAKQLFRQAWENGADTCISAAVSARDSLMMGSLAMRPLRRANFSGLRLGEHVFPDTDRVRIVIPANEMKMGKRPCAADWPDTLAAELTAYLDHVRPVLVRQYSTGCGYEPAGDALWVSKFGTALTAVAIYTRVRALTATQFGVPINLHRFRTIAATTLADGSPENIHLATEVLGHADLRSRDYYIRASGLIASRRSHESEDRQLRAARSQTKLTP